MLRRVIVRIVILLIAWNVDIARHEHAINKARPQLLRPSTCQRQRATDRDVATDALHGRTCDAMHSAHAFTERRTSCSPHCTLAQRSVTRFINRVPMSIVKVVNVVVVVVVVVVDINSIGQFDDNFVMHKGDDLEALMQQIPERQLGAVGCQPTKRSISFSDI